MGPRQDTWDPLAAYAVDKFHGMHGKKTYVQLALCHQTVCSWSYISRYHLGHLFLLLASHNIILDFNNKFENYIVAY